MENQNIKFGTKLLLVYIVNFILSIIGIVLQNPESSGWPAFNIIMECFIIILSLSYYSLFVAVTWQILENYKIYSEKKLPIIATACIFGTAINYIMFINMPNQKPVLLTYIFTAIEILSICVLEQIISGMKKTSKQVLKIANFCDTAIIAYMYLIVLQCFLSWMPINWDFLPFKILWHIVGPYMVLFNNLIPRIVGIDFSPILAVAILLFGKKCFDIYFADIILKLSHQESKEEEEEEEKKENSDENS